MDSQKGREKGHLVDQLWPAGPRNPCLPVELTAVRDLGSERWGELGEQPGGRKHTGTSQASGLLEGRVWTGGALAEEGPEDTGVQLPLSTVLQTCTSEVGAGAGQPFLSQALF